MPIVFEKMNISARYFFSKALNGTNDVIKTRIKRSKWIKKNRKLQVGEIVATMHNRIPRYN